MTVRVEVAHDGTLYLCTLLGRARLRLVRGGPRWYRAVPTVRKEGRTWIVTFLTNGSVRQIGFDRWAEALEVAVEPDPGADWVSHG